MLWLVPVVDILVLTDSRVSLMTIMRSASSGRGCTRDLVEVVDEVSRRSQLGLSMQFSWVKGHVGIGGMSVQIRWRRLAAGNRFCSRLQRAGSVRHGRPYEAKKERYPG